MLLRRAARRLRPQTRGLSAMPTSFADYAEADETMQDYAGNVRRLGRLLGERVAANQEGAAVVAVVERFRHHAKKYRDAREAGHEAEAAKQEGNDFFRQKHIDGVHRLPDHRDFRHAIPHLVTDTLIVQHSGKSLSENSYSLVGGYRVAALKQINVILIVPTNPDRSAYFV